MSDTALSPTYLGGIDPKFAESIATFIVPHTWPNIRNAEFEVLQRLAVAARNVGATMIAVDNDGRPLWASRRISLDKTRPIDPSGIDFMVSLHFESPRLIDVYSYYALWQPLDYYFQFGYGASLEKVLTHNDGLSCLSDMADAHGRNVFSARATLSPDPFPNLFHCAAQPYLEPRIDEHARPFYIGINWERVNKTKGRHGELLELLDRDDLIDIYGPRKFLDVAPWEGFRSYRGELPFDGVSTIKAINKAGICLALSSQAHKRSGLMSNRLFEGLAAGAAVIVDSNRFAQRYFSDVAYFVDDSGSDEETYFQIKSIVERIRRNPEEAIERVHEGQKRLTERFSLETNLRALVASHPKRVEYYHKTALSAGEVTVVMTYHGSSVRTLLDMINTASRQSTVSVSVVLICDSEFYTQNHQLITAAASHVVKFTPITLDLARYESTGGEGGAAPQSTGAAVARALQEIETEFFCFLREDETWFGDHLASLIGSLRRTSDALMSVSGALEETTDMVGTRRKLTSAHFAFNGVDLWNARYSSEYGRFLFSRAVLDSLPVACIPMLDGQEPNLVRMAAALAGELAQTGYATYVQNTTKTARLPASAIPEDQQQQYIRDAFALDRRWLARMASTSPLPQYVYAYSRGAPVRFEEFRHPFGMARKLYIDVLVDVKGGGSGIKYLEHGFSRPESNYTWVEGEYGAIEFVCNDLKCVSAPDHDLILVMAGRNAYDTGRPQHCKIVLNGVALAYVEVPETETRFAFRLPQATFADDGRMRLHLLPDHSELVYDSEGKVIDDRRLSLYIRQFGIESIRVPEIPKLKLGDIYYTCEGGEGLLALRDGFSYPESGWVWVTGQTARLMFDVEQKATQTELVLYLAGRSTSETKKIQSVSIVINGAPAGKFELPEYEIRLAIPLSAEILGSGRCIIVMNFAHAEFLSSADGGGADSRPLAAQLRSFGVFETANIAPPPPPSPSPRKTLVSLLRRVRVILTGGNMHIDESERSRTVNGGRE